MNCTCYTIINLARPVKNVKVTSGLHFCPVHKAAPELLEALKALTCTARTFRDVPKEEREWTSLDDEAIDAAFAAIAKAEENENAR